MKPNFALDLADDMITLLHRGAEGWVIVGKTPFDRDDLQHALAALRQEALARAPEGITTKIVIPNSQILYTAMTAKSGDEAERLEQITAYLEQITPYKRDEMTFDWSKSGDQIMVAAVARETLAEAEAFAHANGFNPISFVANPERGFRFEPWFGRSALADQMIPSDDILERDFDLLEIEEQPSPTPQAEPAPVAPSVTAKPKAPLWVEVPPEAEPAVSAPLAAPQLEAEPQADLSLAPQEPQESAPQPIEAATEQAEESLPAMGQGGFRLPPASTGYADEEDEPVVILPSAAYPSLQSMFDEPDDSAASPSKPLFEDLRAEHLSLNDLPQTEELPQAETLADIWPVAEDMPLAQPDESPVFEEQVAAAPSAASLGQDDIFAALPPRGAPFPLDVKPLQSQAENAFAAPEALGMRARQEPVEPEAIAHDLPEAAEPEAPFAHVQDPLLEQRAAAQDAMIASDDSFGPEAYGKESLAFDPAEELAPADFLQRANAEAAAVAAGERRIKIDRASRSGSAQSPTKLLDEQADFEAPAPSPSSILLRALAARRDAAPPVEVAAPPKRLRPAAPAPRREPALIVDHLQITPAEDLFAGQRPAQKNEAITSLQVPTSLPHEADRSAMSERLSIHSAQELAPQVETAFAPAPPLGNASHATPLSFPPNGMLSVPVDQRRAPPSPAKPSQSFTGKFFGKSSLDIGARRQQPALSQAPATHTLAPAQSGLPPSQLPDALSAADSLSKSARPVRAGGTPKYLGLILTVILLLSMAFIAIWASFSGDEAPAPESAFEQSQGQAAANGQEPLEVAILPDPAPAAAEAAPSGQSQSTLSAAPSAEPAPQVQADQIFLAAEDGPPPASEAGDLPQPNGSTEAPPETPMPPPPFGTVYSFDENGLLVPQANGIQSPDGYTLFSGKPKVLPPAKPAALQQIEASASPLSADPQAALSLAPIVPDSEASSPLIDGLGDEAAAEALRSNAAQPNPALQRFKPRARPDTLVGAAPPGDGAALVPALQAPEQQSQQTPVATAEVQLASFSAPQADSAPLPAFGGPRPPPRPQNLAADQLASASLMANAPPAVPEANVQDVPALDGGLTISLRPAPKPRNFAPSVAPDVQALAAAQSNRPAVDAAVEAAMKEAPPQRQAALQQPAATKAPAQQRTAAEEEDELDEPEVKGTKITAATKASVAKQATESRVINLSQLNLIGIFGSNSNRYAMVRTKNGKFTKVKVGDKIDGGRIQGITQTEVRYQKGNNIHSLALPKG